MTEFTWPERDPVKGSWFGSEELKAWALARMEKHREDDEIIQGVYQEPDSSTPSGYRGCLIGCTLPRVKREGFVESYLIPGVGAVAAGHSKEMDVETLYGIREDVGRLLEFTFEECFFIDAAKFAVESIRAIPVGVHYPHPDLIPYPNYEYASAVLEFLRTAGVPA